MVLKTFLRTSGRARLASALNIYWPMLQVVMTPSKSAARRVGVVLFMHRRLAWSKLGPMALGGGPRIVQARSDAAGERSSWRQHWPGRRSIQPSAICPWFSAQLVLLVVIEGRQVAPLPTKLLTSTNRREAIQSVGASLYRS